MKAYTIRKKDNLWDLAGKFYGKPWAWPLFLKFNSIPNPDLIHPGRTLLFPDLNILVAIKGKSPEQVKKVREELVKQAPPQVITQIGPAKKFTPSPSPSPTPEETPTFKITGSKTINISYAEAVGNSTNGLTNTGYNRNETLRLHMEGQLNDEVKITGDFNQSSLALQDEYDLTLSTKHWELYFGDFPATLPGSQFLTSTMETTGLRATGKYDDWTITAFYGTPMGSPIYQKLFGNQTVGPYTIPGAPFVPNSEIVMLNKQRMTRGTDYSIDYTLGNITFFNRIIQLTDLIEVQAESTGAVFNTQVYGYHTQLALAGKLNPEDSFYKTGNNAAGSSSVTLQGVGGASVVTGSNLVYPASMRVLPSAQNNFGTPTPFPNTVGNTASAGATTTVANPTPTVTAQAVPKGFQWVVGQGYLRQFEQPDFNVTTTTARAAADVHMLELDTVMDWGPPLKIGGEVDGSMVLSSDTDIIPSKQGASYRLQAESFDGPFHFLGKIDGTSPNFVNIGNPLVSGNYLDWMAQGDYKDAGGLFGQGDRSFRRTFTAGPEDDTTTDHGELKLNPKGFPETDYVYYHSGEEIQNPSNPFNQDDLRNTLSLTFGLPGSLSMKTSALQERQLGNNLGESDSYGGRVELSSQKWKDFNFSASGEWRLNDVIEAAANTEVPVATPGNNILSQTYTYTMVGMPVTHLTLTGKGTYTDAPPGPSRANLTETFKTDPYKWLTATGSYSLDFQQISVMGSNSPDQVNTGSGSLDLTPFSWLKLSTQPSFRLDVLPTYGGQLLSRNFHQYYKGALTPSFGSFSGDYTLDQYWTWDGSTAGFPQNFYQQTEAVNAAGKKPLGSFEEDVSFKQTTQNQDTYSSGGNTSTETRNLTETDSTNWKANAVIILTFTHSYNQLDQNSPGQGNISNPLLPYGSDTFNATFPTNSLNAQTYSHTFSGRITEQLSKEISVYEEGGYTHTVDVLEGGTVDTYSPATGFTWHAGTSLSWSGSYQYNGSTGEVDTTIQKAQTTLSAAIVQGTTLALTWNWTRADNPFIQSQLGNVSYSMNF